MRENQGDQLLSRSEVADLLGCHPDTVSKMHVEGAMPAATRVGARSKWRRSVIQAWVKAGCPRREAWDAVATV